MATIAGVDPLSYTIASTRIVVVDGWSAKLPVALGGARGVRGRAARVRDVGVPPAHGPRSCERGGTLGRAHVTRSTAVIKASFCES
jgi:hypothetical protein